jgi:hypothetical protein
MLQRYDISVDEKTNRLSIKEFAVLGRLPRKGGSMDPNREKYFMVQKVSYSGELIQAAIDNGRKALISELRCDAFYPISSCAQALADRVIEIYNDDVSQPSELFFDDRSLFIDDEENDQT